jgi:hypothetical protein
MVTDRLDDLIDKLILHHGGPDSFRRKLEGELPSQSSARRWFLAQAYMEDLSADILKEVVKDATRMAFCAMTPKEAIIALCEFDALLRLLEQEKSRQFAPMDVDKQVLTNAVLQAWNIPQIDRDTQAGAVWLAQQIQAREKDLLTDLDRGVLHPPDAHSGMVGAGALIQQLLEFCLAFHVLCFLDRLPDSALEAMRQIMRRRSLGAAWKAIDLLEIIFAQGAVSGERLRQLKDAERQAERGKRAELRAERDAQERINRRDLIVREMARTRVRIEEAKGSAVQVDVRAMEARLEGLNEMLREAEEAIDKSNREIKRRKAVKEAAQRGAETLDNVIRAEKGEVGERLRKKCRGYLARQSPFESLDKTVSRDLRAQVSSNRNLPAHSTANQVIDSLIKVVDAKDAMNRARSVIEVMRATHYAPRIVTLVADTQDAYGQRMIAFADLQQLRERKGVLPQDLDWMYVSQDFPFRPFRVVALLAPLSGSTVDEPLIEPLTQNLDAVLAMSSYLRGERETWKIEPSS